MSVLWQTAAIVIAVTAWWQTPPQSLAEAAQREALRRQMTPDSTTTLTNLGVPQQPVPAAVTLPDPPAAADPQVAADPQAAAEPPAAEPPAPPRDEQWWRTRMDAARSTLERTRFLADSIQTRINSLQADVVNIDDPAQQALKRQELGKAISELERLQQQVLADEAAIKGIQDEARRNNIPPGWIR